MRRGAAMLAIALFGGCAVGPDYERPDAGVPQAYKEAGAWKLASSSARPSWSMR